MIQATGLDFVTTDELDEMLDYLDFLRTTGETNMFGAAPYLNDEFPQLDKRQASKVVLHWMKTFSERNA